MYIVNPSSEVVVDMRGERIPLRSGGALFGPNMARVARIIARVVPRPGACRRSRRRSLSKIMGANPKARGEKVEGWLYRVALRAGLDELRRQTGAPVTPEELHLATEEQDRVRFVLSIIEPRQAAFLLLRSQGFSYDEVASTLNLNPALGWNPPQPRPAGIPEGVHQALWTRIIQRNSARG